MTSIPKIELNKGFRVQSGENHSGRKVSLSWSKAGLFYHLFKLNSSNIGWLQLFLTKRFADRRFVPQLLFQAFEITDLPIIVEHPFLHNLCNHIRWDAHCIYSNFACHNRNSTSFHSQGRVKLIIYENPRLFTCHNQMGYHNSTLTKTFALKNKRTKLVHRLSNIININKIDRLWKFFKEKITFNLYCEKFAIFGKYCLQFI